MREAEELINFISPEVLEKAQRVGSSLIVGIKRRWTDDPVESLSLSYGLEKGLQNPTFKRAKIVTESDQLMNTFEKVEIEEKEMIEDKEEEKQEETKEPSVAKTLGEPSNPIAPSAKENE